MRGRGACQLDEICRCTFDLEANLARRDHHGRDIVHALVKHGRERRLHAHRRAVAADIAGKAQQVLDMHHLDRLFACRLGFYASPAEVLDYIVPAALFHDIGKNGMIPIINTQHRKLNDYEFNIIQTHPQKGSDYLSSDPDFLIYQPVALGHHRSYDGTRGYPLSFDNTASPYRDAIDLIHICDCLDAATDYLSRNYHRAKPFDVVLNELKAGRGTEYNPDMVDVILSDRELYNDLKMLTEQNRENIYYDIYLTFVNLRKKRQ